MPVVSQHVMRSAFNLMNEMRADPARQTEAEDLHCRVGACLETDWADGAKVDCAMLDIISSFEGRPLEFIEISTPRQPATSSLTSPLTMTMMKSPDTTSTLTSDPADDDLYLSVDSELDTDWFLPDLEAASDDESDYSFNPAEDDDISLEANDGLCEDDMNLCCDEDDTNISSVAAADEDSNTRATADT